MAENTLPVRIQLRFDTLDNWMNSSTILKVGEAAVATYSYARTIVLSDATPQNTPPAIGIKIGDGYHLFSELPWVQAVAGDVYSWAKQATKPVYTASEILDLESFVVEHSGAGQGGDVNIAARVYQIIQGTGRNANKYFLQSRAADENVWTTDYSHYIDLSQFAQVVEWIDEEDLMYYTSLGGRIGAQIDAEFNLLDYNDSPVEGQFIIAVTQNNGKIAVQRKQMEFTDIDGIVLPVHGGTGVNTLPVGQVLVGNGTDPITSIPIDTQVAQNNSLVPNYAIKAYVDEKTAGLTGAMHFIGEATVDINLSVNAAINPQISGYNFANAQPGDVILYNRQELVWTGSNWRLLGDEGSYAIRGSIVDADISPDAAIQQSKILNLAETFELKVDKVDGKQLSTNDYTNEEKLKLEGIETGAQRNIIEHIFVNGTERVPTIVDALANSVSLQIDVFDQEHAAKLDNIEAGAQVNAIEHIFVNGDERPITTVANKPKSVAINFNVFTNEERNKLNDIEATAQVNKIERIFINNTEYFPNNNKEVYITIDQAALNLNVLEGARVPAITSGQYEEVSITQDKKLELARIAKTGNIKDIIQSNEEYITIDCGTSTTVI